MSTFPDFRPIADCLAAIAHPLRLGMLWHLLRDDLTVGELAEKLRISSQVASQHLRLMERCRFLERERRGRNVIYRVVEGCLAELMACIERHTPSPKTNKRKKSV